MKRLILCLCLALCACGGGDDDEEQAGTNPVDCVARPELCR